MRRDTSRKRRRSGWRRADRIDHGKVAWLGRATPLDGDAQMVYEAVVKAALTRYDDVVMYVADALFAEDYRQTGPSGDLGLFRDWYRAIARAILRRLDGAVIAIEGETPVASRR